MKILFQGDSVTDCSRDYNAYYDLGRGYVKYTAESLKEKHPDFTFINRGVSGNRTKDVLARAEEDIVKIDPDIVTMLIGVNDTWRRFDMNDPTTAEQFYDNYEKIIKIIKEKTHAKLIMLEAFIVYGMGRESFREDLNAKLDATRLLAAKYADAFIPLDGILAKALTGPCKLSPEQISADGIHPAEEGKKIIANILKEEIEKLL